MDTAQQIHAELDRIQDSLKEQGEKAMAEASAGKALAQATKDKVDELLNKQGELQANLQAAEQAIAELDSHGGGNAQPQSFGEQFTGSESFHNFAEQTTPRGRCDMTFKAAVTTVDSSQAEPDQATRVPGIIPQGQRRLTVRDLLTPGRMDSASVEFVQETGFQNMAATVAEKAAKPQSDITTELKTAPARVIAHYLKASRQILDDSAQLASFIDGRMIYGLKYVEENQLLNGGGTGQDLNGLTTQASAFSAAFTPSAETVIDRLRLAALQAELAEYPSTGFVLHPTDWAKVELEKDSQNRYIIGNPAGRIGATLWGLPVVTTQAMTAGKFLAGAFKLGAQLFDRWQARVEVSTENEDDFIKNLVTVLAEERLALAVYRPEAFIYGDTVAPST